ncbi:MAG: alpha/beta hydrolase [Kiritimatiellia bacterium]
MNSRYQKWNQSVSRTPEGVLEYAQARTYGDGENALLLVHGFGDGPHAWESLAPLLAEQGYCVRALRIPGWGEPVEVKRKVTLEEWKHGISAELAQLHQSHTKVAVLAHSMGGCLSTVLAQDQQLDADALVLYAPMLEVSSTRSPLFKTRTWYRIGSKVLPDSLIIESIYGDHARVNAPRPKTRRDPFNPKNIFDLLYAAMSEFEAQPPEVEMPLRLVMPGEDRVVDIERTLKWYAELDAPQKMLVTYETAGHVLPLDIDPLAESTQLVLWLSEQGITP